MSKLLLQHHIHNNLCDCEQFHHRLCFYWGTTKELLPKLHDSPLNVTSNWAAAATGMWFLMSYPSANDSIIPTLPQCPHLPHHWDEGASFLQGVFLKWQWRRMAELHVSDEVKEKNTFGFAMRFQGTFLSAQPISTLHQFVGSPCETKGRSGRVTLYLPFKPILSHQWQPFTFTTDWSIYIYIYTSDLSHLPYPTCYACIRANQSVELCTRKAQCPQGIHYPFSCFVVQCDYVREELAVSCRWTGLKFKTSGHLPIILEESIEEYASNEWSKTGRCQHVTSWI